MLMTEREGINQSVLQQPSRTKGSANTGEVLSLNQTTEAAVPVRGCSFPLANSWGGSALRRRDILETGKLPLAPEWHATNFCSFFEGSIATRRALSASSRIPHRNPHPPTRGAVPQVRHITHSQPCHSQRKFVLCLLQVGREEVHIPLFLPSCCRLIQQGHSGLNSFPGLHLGKSRPEQILFYFYSFSGWFFSNQMKQSGIKGSDAR
ncbi:uncharacterized protein LOC110387542 [Numida meleagris]|uniref:uncharacterized protein LOC110387542 n=1 Tax=Numida meleagris TaxID=8996 RepID=UPI000B3DCF9B|nr:uncharacterized protein LOC110387542 [Numida meleagris]